MGTHPKGIMQRRPIRILQILEGTAGGTREHILQIMRCVDRRRFRLSLICSTVRNPEFARDMAALRAEGFEVIEVRMGREIRPAADLRALAQIFAHLRRHRYDVVHTHSSKAGFLGRLAALLRGVRRIYHTPHVFYFQWRPHTATGKFFRMLEWFAAQLTTRIVAVSESQRRIAVRCGVVRPKKIVVIENGVDAAAFRPRGARDAARAELGIGPDTLLVGMVGRLEPQKGCKHYLRAARLVAERMPNVRFILVGGGAIEEKLRRRATKLGLDGVLQFLGQRADLPRLYEAMDLFVLTSLWEGLPYVILEAMAAGRAVIATDVPGSHDLVRPGETGYLVPPEDDRAIALATLKLLRDPAMRESMGRRAVEIVSEQYSRDRFIRKLEELYAEA